jgi:hypothetical protein
VRLLEQALADSGPRVLSIPPGEPGQRTRHALRCAGKSLSVRVLANQLQLPPNSFLKFCLLGVRQELDGLGGEAIARRLLRLRGRNSVSTAVASLN